MLLRTPILTGAILLSLALGIGANTAMFSIVDAVLLRPARFPVVSALTLVWERDPEGALHYASAANFLDWRQKSHSFSALAAWSRASFVMGEGERSEQISGAAVTANFFETLRARPVLGRTFLPGEDGGPIPGDAFSRAASASDGRAALLENGIPKPSDASQVVILSYGTWQEQLGANPSVIGSTVRLNQVPYTVVGVMGPDFGFLRNSQSVWVPLMIHRENRDYRFLTVVGRLNQPRATAVAEMSALAQSLAVSYPKTNKGWTIEVDDLRDWLAKTSYPARLLLVASALGLILLVACANIASLLLARSAARARELSVRAALGATPGRIVRQLLTESFILAVLGGALGVLLAAIFIGAASKILPPALIPAGAPVEVNQLVLAFTAGVSVATGVLFGWLPALVAARNQVQPALQDSSRGSTGGRVQRWFREGIVVGEIAVALMLVSGAGLILASLKKLEAVDPGCRIDHILTLRMFLPASRYDASQALALHRRVLERVLALPGVESATLATNLPLLETSINVPFDLETAPPRSLEERPGVNYIGISPSYLETLGIPLKGGRMFTDADRENAPPVVIVNEAFSARYFPGQDPVGKRVLLNRPILGKDDFEDTIRPEIVGVIGDVKMGNLNGRPQPILYAPDAQSVWSPVLWLAIRGRVDSAGWTAAVRRAMFELDKDVPVGQARNLEQVYVEQFIEPRFESHLMDALAVLALALAGIGIYSILAYSVAQRSREIALRVALGASSGAILFSVLGRGLKVALMGILAGVAGALVAGRLLKSFLVGVNGQDPLTLSVAALLLLVVSAVACYVPALKAIRIDPGSALRQE